MRFGLFIVSLLLLATALSSCSLPFYWQAVSGQLELLRKRVPIDEVLTDPLVETDVKFALTQMELVRQYAIDELALPDNGSYTTYADLERDYVVWNVVATQEFSIQAEQWCFPFAGCVSYRGFFSRDRAEAFAERLLADGLDTYSGGSSAYSTLGYFADPILNTMIDSRIEVLAALLIHELAHQKMYIKGDSELSEAFASVIEEHGTRTWLGEREDAAALARYDERLTQREVFAYLIGRYQTDLGALYAADKSPTEMRSAKQLLFNQLQADYARLRDSGQMSADYDGWFAQRLNNATLASVATYRRWVPALKYRLGQVGLLPFYLDVERLSMLGESERTAELEEWNRLATRHATAAQQ